MSQPYRSYRPGQRVLVEATVLEHCNNLSKSSVAKLRFEDFPSFVVTTFAPVSKIAAPEDIDRLLSAPQAEPF